MLRYNPDIDGQEKRCPKCGEWWPADTEFFFKASDRPDGLLGRCRDCYIARKFPNGRGKTQVTLRSPWESLVGYVENDTCASHLIGAESGT